MGPLDQADQTKRDDELHSNNDASCDDGNTSGSESSFEDDEVGSDIDTLEHEGASNGETDASEIINESEDWPDETDDSCEDGCVSESVADTKTRGEKAHGNAKASDQKITKAPRQGKA